ELYVYSADTSDWSSVDTNGFAFDNVYNSEEDWEAGAFSNLGTNHPDYGWGTYNSSNHNINGNRLFILKAQSGDYYKVVIDQLSIKGLYTFRTAMLDGSNSKSYTYERADARSKDKNFALLNVTTGMFDYTNPNVSDWDLLFTKYQTEVSMGPTTLVMPVSGVKINSGCEVAERSGLDVSSNDTSSLVWGSNITEIGYDWKVFDRSTFMYNMTEDLAYFVRTANGAVWKIYFTAYEGGASAQSNFVIEEIKAGVNSVDERASLNTNIYPNPSRGVLNIDNREGENLSIELLDIRGVVVLKSEVNAFDVNTIRTADFSKGFYFIRLNSATSTSTKRVIFE
ncbi:MAG: T9SS type A sorting domain-containing protein, partial [Bacteroidia bacterium]